MKFPGRVATRIINEVKGINRITCDITSKPPGNDRVRVILQALYFPQPVDFFCLCSDIGSYKLAAEPMGPW